MAIKKYRPSFSLPELQHIYSALDGNVHPASKTIREQLRQMILKISVGAIAASHTVRLPIEQEIGMEPELPAADSDLATVLNLARLHGPSMLTDSQLETYVTHLYSTDQLTPEQEALFEQGDYSWLRK